MILLSFMNSRFITALIELKQGKVADFTRSTTSEFYPDVPNYCRFNVAARSE